MKTFIGGLIGAVIGIPGSYFFQNEMVRAKFGGVGDYVLKFGGMFDSKAWDMGVPQNMLLGIAVFAAIGAVIGFVIGRTTKKQ